jgi:hypothetical protein
MGKNPARKGLGRNREAMEKVRELRKSKLESIFSGGMIEGSSTARQALTFSKSDLSN